MRRAAFISGVTGCLVAFWTLSAWASPGGLDHSFGGDGRATASFSGDVSDAWDLAVQPDDKVVVVGGLEPAEPNWNWGILRYKPNGTLDPNFGGGDGKVTTAWTPGDDEAYAVKILSNGKILVAGQAGSDIAIARYASNGTLDSSFGGGDGKVITDLTPQQDSAWDIELIAGGRFLVGGEAGGDFAVLEYGSHGGLVTSFGTGGIAKMHSHNGAMYGREIAVQANGKILETGHISSGASYAIALARFTADGHHDTTFGGGHTGLVVALEDRDAEGWGIEPLPGGEVLVAGYGQNGNQQDSPLDAAVLRFTNTGVPDTTFGGGDGIAFADLGDTVDYVLAMVVLPSGKLLVAGSEGPKAGPSDAVVARLRPNGALDTALSGDGIAHAGFAGAAQFWGLGLTSSNSIVASGYSYDGPDSDVYSTARFLG